LLIADPDGSALDLSSKQASDLAMYPVILMIGPEGGFSSAELNLAMEKGAQTVKLSEGILRIETAAIVFAGLVRLSLNQTQSDA